MTGCIEAWNANSNTQVGKRMQRALDWPVTGTALPTSMDMRQHLSSRILTTLLSSHWYYQLVEQKPEIQQDQVWGQLLSSIHHALEPTYRTQF